MASNGFSHEESNNWNPSACTHIHVYYYTLHDDCQLIHKQGEIHLIVFAHI